MPTPSSSQEADDELIPTAIVIKNIPFAVKKEQLVQLMTDMNLPLPYAFNYHFDNGVFRGLAFANFTSAEETATVIEVLNHFELQGRKLRVEYKKMLPLQERERIEREKRERRGQLEEQHRPMASSQLQTQSSMSSLTSHMPATSPSPVSQRGPKLGMFHGSYAIWFLILKKKKQSRQKSTSTTARRSSSTPNFSCSRRTSAGKP
jgi:RNA recognition motif-containing protein